MPQNTINVSNSEFINAIFGEDTPFAHVTCFHHDPSNIPAQSRAASWGGGWFSRYTLRENTNQYFTISIFNPEGDRAVRRKGNFLRTRCIVLDDVREKLSIEEANRLPTPSWILETSQGSEQWGYILSTPVHDRDKVDNLLDGLVESDLAPKGDDPGMKGVTRYVRLPEGINNKASKLVNGQPFKCRMLAWNPFMTVELEELAAPFGIDIRLARADTQGVSAKHLPDHPIFKHIDELNINTRSNKDGTYDITCPWVEDHTDQADDGSAIFTNEDGSIGFRCHHGGCEDHKKKAFNQWLNREHPMIFKEVADYKASLRESAADMFKDIAAQEVAVKTTATPAEIKPDVDIHEVINEQMYKLKGMHPNSDDFDKWSEVVYNSICQVPETSARKKGYLGTLKGDLGFTNQKDFKDWVKAQDEKRFGELGENKNAQHIFDNHYHIGRLGVFLDRGTGEMHDKFTFRDMYAHVDPQMDQLVLNDERSRKLYADVFAPGEPEIFLSPLYDNRPCYNTFNPKFLGGMRKGDPSPWLNHMDRLGFTEAEQHHLLQWMAFTIQHPDKKINHAIMLGGAEGIGKDLLFAPLMRYFNRYVSEIGNDELQSPYGDWIPNKKVVLVNEVKVGGTQAEIQRTMNLLKSLIATPPDTIQINEKFKGRYVVKNILALMMTTNHKDALVTPEFSRRFFMLWSNNYHRGEDGDITPEAKLYFKGMFNWLNNGGAEICAYYLMNYDITGFNPSESPDPTDWALEMLDMSKPQLQIEIEKMIKNKTGRLAADLVTVEDIQIQHEMTYGAPSVFTKTPYMRPASQKVSRVMGDIKEVAKKRARKDGKEANVWIVRDLQRYLSMSCGNLYEEYKLNQEKVVAS